MQNVKSFLRNLPDLPGVYQMLGEKGDILYIGKARNLKKRVSSYFSGKQQDIKTQVLIKHIDNIDIIVTRTENEALLLECNLIKKHRPHYNVIFRDDKSYPYILITKDHPYPRIDFYRGSKKRDGLYFGPYPNTMAVRETIQLIQKLFRIRTCNDHFFKTRTRPCLLYQIERCTGPCVELITPDKYDENIQLAILFLQGKNQIIIDELNKKMDAASTLKNYEQAVIYRDQILNLREIQQRQYVSAGQGEVDVIGFATSSGVSCIQLLIIRHGRILGSRSYFPSSTIESTSEEMVSSFIMQHYLSKVEQDIPKEIILEFDLTDRSWLESALSEQAKFKVELASRVRGDRKKWLETATTSAKQSIASQMVAKFNMQERFSALKSALDLGEVPSRLECFDVSHTMGEETVASCVVFDKNGPLKSDYRRFNITGITPGDDIAAMKQALTRRYKRAQSEPGKIPDILFIDGGKPQLNAALAIIEELGMHEGIQLVGIAKGLGRKPGLETLIIPGKPSLHLPPDSQALHLIQHIRDEAHRFAITAHRQRRDKKRHTSVLESIPGIGAKRRRELLRYFGGIQAINHASLDEIAKVPGISQSLAERIFEALHDVSV
jgi:excinuclease ABC subunit C